MKSVQMGTSQPPSATGQVTRGLLLDTLPGPAVHSRKVTLSPHSGRLSARTSLCRPPPEARCPPALTLMASGSLAHAGWGWTDSHAHVGVALAGAQPGICPLVPSLHVSPGLPLSGPPRGQRWAQSTRRLGPALHAPGSCIPQGQQPAGPQEQSHTLRPPRLQWPGQGCAHGINAARLPWKSPEDSQTCGRSALAPCRWDVTVTPRTAAGKPRGSRVLLCPPSGASPADLDATAAREAMPRPKGTPGDAGTQGQTHTDRPQGCPFLPDRGSLLLPVPKPDCHADSPVRASASVPSALCTYSWGFCPLPCAW